MKVLSFLSVFIFASCSLLPDRSYYEIMDPTMQPTAMFKPREDFKVVYGDEGNGWTTEEEVVDRTPPTEVQSKRYEFEMTLDQELYALELKQSEKQLAHYRQYDKFLTDISEKIYFLRLPTFEEREDFLTSRGYNLTNFGRNYRKLASKNQEVTLGMERDEVAQIWGTPYRIDQALTGPVDENERWTYLQNGSTKYIYFKSGRVEGWTTE